MYRYEFQEYEKQMEKLKKVSDEVMRFKKGDNPLTLEHIDKKLGTKTEMAGLVIRLTSACLDSMKTLEKLHKHNFDLRGKVAELSTAALDEIRTDLSRTQSELKNEIIDLKNQIVQSAEEEKKSYAGAVGDSQSLVGPIRKAMRQVKTEDLRMKNVIVHGLDIKPDIPKEGLVEYVKNMASEIVHEIDGEGLYNEPEELTVLGEISASGRAPPVLVRSKTGPLTSSQTE